MDEDSHKNLFLHSLNRCTESEDFIPSFYNHFLASSSEIRAKFRNTNFAKQNQMLLRSLNLASGATAGDPEALRDLLERAESHDRHHLNIKPELYDLWRSAIIETACEFDDQWNEDIGTAWHIILGYIISHMTKRY